MTDEAMSPLRRRMIEDMTIRKFAPKTQHDYVQRVKNFAAFLGRSPDTATFEDVRRYQLHLASDAAAFGTQWSSTVVRPYSDGIGLSRADDSVSGIRNRKSSDKADAPGNYDHSSIQHFAL